MLTQVSWPFPFLLPAEVLLFSCHFENEHLTKVLQTSLQTRSQEFTAISSIIIQHPRVHSSLLPSHTCNSTLQHWESCLMLHSIYLVMILCHYPLPMHQLPLYFIKMLYPVSPLGFNSFFWTTPPLSLLGLWNPVSSCPTPCRWPPHPSWALMAWSGLLLPSSTHLDIILTLLYPDTRSLLTLLYGPPP